MENSSLINIDDQTYKIDLIKYDNLLKIVCTNTRIQILYECVLNDDSIRQIGQKAGFVRNMDQFYAFMDKGSKNESGGKFSLIGKIDNDILILTLGVKLGLDNDETIQYVIQLSKVEIDMITRIEKMVIGIYEKFEKHLDSNGNSEQSQISSLRNMINNVANDTKNEIITLSKMVDNINDILKRNNLK